MGMVLMLASANESELKEMQAEPDLVDAFFDESEDFCRGDMIDFDKAWQALHYVLVGSAEPVAHPLSLYGFGDALGEDLGYGPAVVWTPAHVLAFRDELSKIPDDELRARYNPAEMAQHGVYLAETLASEPLDESWEYVSQGLPDLRKFADRCVDQGLAVISLIT
jgi:hypothetical protein